MILWQCIADKIIEFVIQDELISSQARKCSQARTLGSIEENAIHYAGSYFIKKIIKFIQKTAKYDGCIDALISLVLDDVSSHRAEESFLKYTQTWLDSTDRGGLYHISNLLFSVI